MSSAEKRAKSAPRFKADPWCLIEEGFSRETQSVSETLFAQANGYLGTRGTFEDAVERGVSSVEGTFLNGVYLREEIHYDESAYGFATHNNKMILVPDGKAFRLTAEGEELTQGESELEAQARSLDMKTGLLERSSLWRPKAGGTLEVKVRRFVSMARPGLMAIEYSLVSHGFEGGVVLETGLDAGYGGTNRGGDPRAGALSIRDCLEGAQADRTADVQYVGHKVHGSEHLVGAAYCLDGVGGKAATHAVQGAQWREHLSFSLGKGDSVTLIKYVGYCDGPFSDAKDLKARLQADISDARALGFDALLDEHKRVFADFWAAADIQVDAGAEVQQGVRFNLFHLFQSAGKDGNRALSAKGLTGAGYDGHYFWDTEIYAVPFFVFSRPEVALALLEYRISTLDKARERARTMAHKRGALFPWRTIGGEECSSYFPAGTGQYHINAAVAYAAIQYVAVTGDEGFWQSGGAELLFETARIWMDLGHFNARKGGRFCITEVTGPDEYTAMADNNLYTNAMAQHHLREAAALAADLKARTPEVFASVCAEIDLDEEEFTSWSDAAERMYLPYDEERGIYEQCDGFLDKPEWDFENTPAENYPLLLHYHPLVIYRHQVLKQPDVVLAQTLLSDRFSREDKMRNLAYYEPRTTHDSTLSVCIYAVANAEVGDKAKALEFFEETYRMDIDNRHGNTHYGVHMACMAGSWMSMTYGFAGMRFAHGTLSFAPYLPDGWNGYKFMVTVRGRRLGVSVAAEGTRYELLSGENFSFEHCGQAVTLGYGESQTLTA
ncbi:glycoside hydrolase family 65 protein [Kordiimonas aestuarii]|uniref:glycoside hydrolase family 65 protein n=1 Tax=Kordiimonas aestuarii TaxID=1005925 RepID=UPI0021D0B1E2|nr:glycosyl hydrolase family 65 protein [Kordiimonas aestuarii]